MSEHAIQNRIRNALAGLCLCWRANVGCAWTGDVTRLADGSILIVNPRRFSTGLPDGFSDLFGIVPIRVTPEMIGDTVGRFFAAEVKAPRGVVQPSQTAFLEAVRRQGGVSGVVRSTDEALALVTGYERGSR